MVNPFLTRAIYYLTGLPTCSPNASPNVAGTGPDDAVRAATSDVVVVSSMEREDEVANATQLLMLGTGWKTTSLPTTTPPHPSSLTNAPAEPPPAEPPPAPAEPPPAVSVPTALPAAPGRAAAWSGWDPSSVALYFVPVGGAPAPMMMLAPTAGVAPTSMAMVASPTGMIMQPMQSGMTAMGYQWVPESAASTAAAIAAAVPTPGASQPMMAMMPFPQAMTNWPGVGQVMCMQPAQQHVALQAAGMMTASIVVPDCTRHPYSNAMAADHSASASTAIGAQATYQPPLGPSHLPPPAAEAVPLQTGENACHLTLPIPPAAADATHM